MAIAFEHYTWKCGFGLFSILCNIIPAAAVFFKNMFFISFFDEIDFFPEWCGHMLEGMDYTKQSSTLT